MKTFISTLVILFFFFSNSLAGLFAPSPITSLLAASRIGEITIVATDGQTTIDKPVPRKKQHRQFRKEKRKGFFGKIVSLYKLKKQFKKRDKTGTGHLALYALIGAVVTLVLGGAFQVAVLSILGLLLLISSFALGKDAMSYSEGVDQRMGKIARNISGALLIAYVIAAVIVFIWLLALLAAI